MLYLMGNVIHCEEEKKIKIIQFEVLMVSKSIICQRKLAKIQVENQEDCLVPVFQNAVRRPFGIHAVTTLRFI